MTRDYFFKDVTLLITHYNRSKSLEQLLRSFSELNCRFEDIVVSDDGSKIEHLSHMVSLQKEFNFRLITTPKNKGLGHNINKGQDGVKSLFTLYVQEDFTPTALFPESFGNALNLIRQKDEIDMIRFYAYFEYPYLGNPHQGYYETGFKIWKPGYQKFYVYSDHPHLRRSSFFEKFGRYIEGQKGDVTEYSMMMSFLKKNGKALFYKDYQGLFVQKNSEAEPSTMKRDVWRESDNFLMTQLRHLYRHMKFNINYLMN